MPPRRARPSRARRRTARAGLAAAGAVPLVTRAEAARRRTRAAGRGSRSWRRPSRRAGSGGRSTTRGRLRLVAVSGRGLCRYQNRGSGGSPVASESQRARRAVALLGPTARSRASEPKPISESTGFAWLKRDRRSRARSSRAAGLFSIGTRLSRWRGAWSAGNASTPATTAARHAQAARGPSPSVSPAAATSSGDGVSPAAIAASSGSRPPSIAATTSAEGGRLRGSFSRHARIVRSTAGARPGASSAGSIGRSSR